MSVIPNHYTHWGRNISKGKLDTLCYWWRKPLRQGGYKHTHTTRPKWEGHVLSHNHRLFVRAGSLRSLMRDWSNNLSLDKMELEMILEWKWWICQEDERFKLLWQNGRKRACPESVTVSERGRELAWWLVRVGCGRTDPWWPPGRLGALESRMCRSWWQVVIHLFIQLSSIYCVPGVNYSLDSMRERSKKNKQIHKQDT